VGSRASRSAPRAAFLSQRRRLDFGSGRFTARKGVGSALTPSRRRNALAELASKRFETPDEVHKVTDDKGQVEVVDLNGHSVGRGTFEPGWRWSVNVKPLAGTDSCQVEHIGYVVSGGWR
jgi:hypothetical protein